MYFNFGINSCQEHSTILKRLLCCSIILGDVYALLLVISLMSKNMICEREYCVLGKILKIENKRIEQ